MPERILEGGADAVRRLNRFSLHVLGLVARVRPDERRDVVGAFLTLFGFMTGHALLETARDALFLASLSARQLPWVYLAIAGLALVVGQREPRVVRKLSARNELGRWLSAAGVVTAGFWLLVHPERTWSLYGLYVWSGVLASLVVVRFWTVLGGRLTVTQAKRVFPVIASGSVAGAIFGSGAARALIEVVAPRSLVLAAAAVFLATAAAPSLITVVDTPPRRRQAGEEFRQVARAIMAGPYLRRVAGLVLLATVTFTLVDFVFKSAADRYVAPEDLGAFFSSVYLTLNVLSLFVQLFAVAALLRLVGLVRTAAVVPAVLLVSTLGFAVGGGLGLALLLKGADGTLRHSLYRTSTELLFIPLSERMRTQVKGLIDVLGQRGGQAVASVLILMLLSTTLNERVVAGLACLTAVGWLVVALGVREHYLNLFRETLTQESGRRRTEFPALDMASLETLLATLNTADDRRVLAALDVLEESGKASVVPALLLYHPSPAVLIRALDLFQGADRQDVVAMVARLCEHEAAEVRAAAIRALASLGPSSTVFEAALGDADPGVVASARIALCAAGWAEAASTVEALERLIAEAGVRAQGEIARSLRANPTPALEPVVIRLLALEDEGVLGDAIRAASALGTPRVVDPLIALLGERGVRDQARIALATMGPLSLERLAATLNSKEVPPSVRRHVPGAIALVGSPQAPEILLRHLKQEPDGMIRFKVLRALGRWRNEQPGFPLDVSLIREALGHAVSTAFRLMGWRRVLVQARLHEPALETELSDALIALLRDKQDHALERVFRLLNLQSGSEEFQRVFQGLHSAHPQARAGSRELLYHLVLPPLRGTLMTLVDDLHGEEREPDSDGSEAHEAYGAVLTEIIECGMESASSFAAAHAEEAGISAVEPSLMRTRPLSDEHAATLERARASILRRSA